MGDKRSIRRGAGLAGLALLVGGCLAAPAVTPSPSPLPSATPQGSPAVPPSITPIPTSGPGSPDPSATATPPPGATGWVEISRDWPSPRFADEFSLMAFDGGYIVHSFGSAPVFFSRDGVRWRRVRLPTEPPRCPDGGSEFIFDAVAGGSSVAFIGQRFDASCFLTQTFTWVSSDGRNWQRSQPIDNGRNETERLDVDMWPIPGGWEIAIGDGDQSTRLWTSVDGLSWQPEASFGVVGDVRGAADAQGNRILSIYERLGSAGPIQLVPMLLATSTDGVTWHDLDAPHRRAAAYGVVTSAFPPGPAQDRWVVEVWDFDQNDARLGNSLWASADLVSWERVRRRAVFGTDYSPPDGDVIGIADGPAGVIAVMADGRVYRLVR